MEITVYRRSATGIVRILLLEVLYPIEKYRNIWVTEFSSMGVCFTQMHGGDLPYRFYFFGLCVWGYDTLYLPTVPPALS